ncbi:hypothetical protein FOZ62_005001 [Perkinsus olseni]|uniref:Uncharacterized protein n=1 Tax=Perkinsus olseni TaxID=32597 RepID=A0A7J6UBL7_PEROL|nr:hypothetical protein FOZ62_005001 [Perkinsus olseni]
MVEVTGRFEHYISDLTGNPARLSPLPEMPDSSPLHEQVNKTVDLIAAVSANLATDRSTWRAGKTPRLGFKDESADAREKAGTAIDDLGALLKEQGRRLKGSSPAFYRSVKEILAGRLKAVDDEARQWQMYKHRVSSRRCFVNEGGI